MASILGGYGRQFVQEVDDITCSFDPTPNGRSIGFIDSDTFLSRDYHLQWLVNRIMVQGQPAIIGGPKKVLKTSLLIDLAISLASGRRFLAHFDVERRTRVGVFSGESGPATIQETFRRICRSKGVLDPEALSVYWGFTLPRLSFDVDLIELEEAITENELEVVILDPLYLCLLAGSTSHQASNIFDIGPLLANTAEVCLAAGATPILVHHTTKSSGRSGGPPELEDLAFAGIQEFARQWLLVGRREPYVHGSGQHHLWLNVGRSAGHSGCWAVDVDEGQLQHDFGGRTWHVRVRTASDECQSAQASRDAVRRERDVELDTERRGRIRDALQRYPDGETFTRLRDSSGLGGHARRILDEMVDAGEAERIQIQKSSGRGSRPYEGYRRVLPVADPELEGAEIDDAEVDDETDNHEDDETDNHETDDDRNGGGHPETA